MSKWLPLRPESAKMGGPQPRPLLASFADNWGKNAGASPLKSPSPDSLKTAHFSERARAREARKRFRPARTPARCPSEAGAPHLRMAARLLLPLRWGSEGGSTWRPRPCYGHAQARSGRPSRLPYVGAGPLLVAMPNSRAYYVTNVRN